MVVSKWKSQKWNPDGLDSEASVVYTEFCSSNLPYCDLSLTSNRKALSLFSNMDSQ